jgi:hypothetical protein
MNRSTLKLRTTLIAAAGAGLALLVALSLALTPDAVEAKKKKKRKPVAGPYVGNTTTTRDPLPVRFTLTPQGNIVNFVIPGVRLLCSTEYDGAPTVFSDRMDTLAAPPLSIGPVPRKKLPLGRTFQYVDPLPPLPDPFGPRPAPGAAPYRGIFVRGITTVLRPKPFSQPPFGPGFQGRAGIATFSNTRGAYGTEACDVGGLWDPGEIEPGFEWKAVRAGKR